MWWKKKIENGNYASSPSIEIPDDEIRLTKKRKKRAKLIIRVFTIATLGSGYILYLALRYLLNEMAKENNLVTFRTDGEIKAIMRGDTCVRYLMKVENHRIDPDGFDIFKGSLTSYAAELGRAAEEKRKDPGFRERKIKPIGDKFALLPDVKEAIEEANSTTLFEEIFGVYWVGFVPYRVFIYPFRWLKYGQRKGAEGIPSEQVDVHPREDDVDSLYFRYSQYALKFSKLETGAGVLLKEALDKEKGKGKGILVQVKGTLVFETVTKNPQKTLFRTAALSSAGDWQQALIKEITDRIRKWLGTTDWDTVIGEKEKVADGLDQIREKINEVAIKDYGQEIVRISMTSIDLEDDSLQQAYQSVLLAEKKRDADIAEADGIEAKSAAPVLGKAKGLKAISQIPGGKEMYMAEQIGNIRVYAPGRDGLLLGIAEEVTGTTQQTKKSEISKPSVGKS
jgi:hypothetical protein